MAEFLPFLRDGLTHECEDSVSELLLTWVVAIIGNVLMQDGSKPLNRIKIGAVEPQLDQMDTTSYLAQKRGDIRPFVAGGVVPDDMNDALAAFQSLRVAHHAAI